METEVMRILTKAVDLLYEAEKQTKLGFVSDHCHNALREIQFAMQIVIKENNEFAMFTSATEKEAQPSGRSDL